ncbi:MAG: Hsp20/alpha crystallin family protein [Nitrospirae bacterium]|nr:Hsp20/alpha crystallin family protein [Nitrospirota bacterium]
MTEKTNKTAKESRDVEMYRPTNWLAPIRRMEDSFEDFFRRPFGRTLWPGMPRLFEEMEPVPSVDIFEEGDDVVLKTELPGLEKSDIDVSLTDSSVVISGEKKKEEKIDRRDFYLHERSFGSFSRSVSLPSDVQADKAKASFKNGVLEIRVPKTEEAKRKETKIKIE